MLILDEPASGLDPRARIEILEVLKTLGSMGKTVLISSHILSELRQLCNKICIIDHGQTIYAGTIDEVLLRARTQHRLEIRLVDRTEDACDSLGSLSGLTDVHHEDGTILVELPDDTVDFSFVADHLVQNGFRVLTIKEEELMLEDAFIRLTDANGNKPAPINAPLTPPPPPPLPTQE